MEYFVLPGMIDAHFHGAVMKEKGMDTEQNIKTAVKKGLYRGIDAGISPDDYYMRKSLLKEIPEIILSAGCYPAEVETTPVNKLLHTLEKLLAEEKGIRAIGEIGLDWHWNYGTKEKQKDLFTGQLALAERFNLPVIIHNREADNDLLDCIKEIPLSGGGMMHCFSSDYATAVKLLDRGFYLSFAGNLTYKKNEWLRDIAKKVPLEKLFLETDSPFLSPQKQRGRLNHPGHIGYVYETLAVIRGIKKEEVIEQVKKNFETLFT